MAQLQPSARTEPETAAAIIERTRAKRMAVPPYTRLRMVPSPTPSEGPDPYGSVDPEWLGIDWRDHLHSVEVDGRDVNYVSIGDGEPVICVHGLSGCWQNWLENLPALAGAGYRAIALDLPGYGASPAPDWEISIGRYADLLDRFRARVGLDDTVIVANSMGGLISTELAARRPDWLTALCLVSPAEIGHPMSHARAMRQAARAGNHLARLAVNWREFSLRRRRLRRIGYESVFRFPLLLRTEFLWEISVHAVDASPVFVDSVIALGEFDEGERFRDVEAPSLVVWGRDDRIVHSGTLVSYLERMPHAEHVVMASTGHLAMAERPTRFNRLLLDFLSRHSR